jgi:hypothetical protein
VGDNGYVAVETCFIEGADSCQGFRRAFAAEGLGPEGGRCVIHDSWERVAFKDGWKGANGVCEGDSLLDVDVRRAGVLNGDLKSNVRL